MTGTLTRQQWQAVLEAADPATYGEIVAALKDRDLFDGDADALVDAAIDDGQLVAAGDGAFPTYELPEIDGDEGVDPLSAYEPQGYAYPVDGKSEQRTRARDAAMALTASPLAPVMTAHPDAVDEGEWWTEAQFCACSSLEYAIVDALVTETDDDPTQSMDAEEPASGAGHDDETPTPRPPETGLQGGEDTDIDVSGPDDLTPSDETTYHAHPSGRTCYPPALKERPWWVNWVLAVRYGEMDGDTVADDATPTKQPIAPYRNGSAKPVKWNFGLSDDEHPSTAFETVERWTDTRVGVDIHAPARVQSDRVGSGIIIPTDQDDRPVTLLDWDDVRDPETEEVHPVCAWALEEIGGYAEISQSGEGIHQFVYGEIPAGFSKFLRHVDDEPFISDDLPMVEMYSSGRLTAMTGQHVEGTGDDVVEGQDVIDTICWVFGNGTNNAPGSVSDPYANDRPNAGRDAVEAATAPSHAEVGDAMRETVEYDGDDPEQWDIPDGESVEYHAVLRARERSDELPNTANWELLGYAAALGHRDGKTKAEILEDLKAHPTPQYGYNDSRARKEVRGVLRKVESGNYEAPSREKLADRGILPMPDDEHPRADPRNVDVVVHPERAWGAAGRVTPADLDDEADDLPLEVTADGAAWVCPECGARVDVIRAGAIASGRIGRCDGDLGDDYHAAYREARERYGAPLPRYLTNEDATARYDVLVETIRELSFWDLDQEAFTVDVTAEGDETSTSDAALEIDPTPAFDEHGSWRESDSGRSVVVYPSGEIRDYGHPDAGEKGKRIDPLRFVALDSGLILNAADRVEGGTFRAAVTAARRDYGAPLPRWETGTPAGHTPMLPAAEDLVDDEDGSDPDALQATRDDVEELYREVCRDGETPSVLTVPPAGGKTTAAIKNAAPSGGHRPTTYLAPRKSLMQQAVEKADEWGASWQALPVFGGTIDDATLEEAVAYVRENGRDSLRNRWQVLGAATDGGELPETDDEDDDRDDPEGDEFDEVRPTCPTAEGDLGDDWQLAVHVARRIGFSPRDIHADAEGIFGRELPCQHDGDCPYSDGWDAVSDPENPPDLLIGHYVHAYVESARTHYKAGPDGRINRQPRTVVLDEFPGLDTFGQTFGDEALTHAAWLAGALRDEIDDRHDLMSRDLWTDDFVRKWLNAEADELDGVDDAVAALENRARLLDAAAEADRLLTTAGDPLEHYGLFDPLQKLADGKAGVDLDAWTDRLEAALREARGKTGYDWVLEAVTDDVLQPARGAATHAHVKDAVADLDVGGDLRQLVVDALDATAGFEYENRRRLQGARDALVGGDDGARELAIWAKDGWAHPDAHHLLRGVITPTGPDEPGSRPRSRNGGHDGAGGWTAKEEGTNLSRVEYDGTTVLFDRNDAGATIYSPPDRTAGSGDAAPFIGLDATAEKPLWELVLGETVQLRDVHASPQDRQAFLRDQLGLQVVQIGDEARPYEGDPQGKDLDGDVALLEEIQEQYTGVHAARDRDDAPATTGRPAAITTRGVRDVLEADGRLDDVVAEWENYGNLTGENDLADHETAAILGSPHYGHHTVDFVAALAGEEAVPTGRGMALEYGGRVADAYLKHMRENQVMQAILRFTRGDSGALVFVRTAALREDLPVVAKGDVARTWSDTATTIAQAVNRSDGGVTVSQLVERRDVDATKRHVRRILSELTDAGYLTREVDRDGVAGEYGPGAATPGTHDVGGLPSTDAPGEAAEAGQDSHKVYYTADVRVAGRDRRLPPALDAPGTVLDPPPDDALADPGQTPG